MQSVVKLKIPANNILERQYVIDIIFNEFLGISYDITISNDIKKCEILFLNNKILVCDFLWKSNSFVLSYLSLNNLPIVSWTTNQFCIEKDIPILYGSSKLEITDNQIVCGIDIFASIFFMLTRWEEYVNKVRDKHNRFPGRESIAYKNNFLHRPVVNEYVEMLWNMMTYLGYAGERRDRKFELVLTHDIDYMNTSNIGITLGADILKRKDFVRAYNTFKGFFKDPFDTFEFLMNLSESIGLKSHFYFMAANSTSNIYDTPCYINSKKFKHLINQIKDREHIIGFHPGYETSVCEEKWKYELSCLERASNIKLYEGRQHYLMIDIVKTLTIWNDNNMEIDSTLGYADQLGFRCGTGDVYPVFDFCTRKELRLKERPLVIMDTTLKYYQKLSLEDTYSNLEYYIFLGKKYSMTLTFLFHNSSFDNNVWSGWKALYENVILNNFHV